MTLRVRAKTTTIYRHYDRCGCLLYVGVAYDVIQRNYAHTGQSWWSPWIERIQLEETAYTDRRAALDAERRFIKSETPIFNQVHAVDRDRSIVRYLIQHERWEHLIAPAASTSPAGKVELLRALAEADQLDSVEWTKEPQAHVVDWSDPVLRRFIDKTEPDENGCLIWQAAFREQQYPYFHHPKTRMAARAAWLLFRGPLAEGVRVEQRCGRRECVNHRHLRTVPAKAPKGRYMSSTAKCEINHPGAPSRWMRREDGRAACRECNRVLAARRVAAQPG